MCKHTPLKKHAVTWNITSLRSGFDPLHGQRVARLELLFQP